MIELAGASVTITGGATGIGLALAREIGRRGARLILFEPREDVLQGAVVELAGLGIDAAGFAGDVTKPDDVEALADFAWSRHGRADLLINNAGVGGPVKAVVKYDLAAARAVFEVNFWGVLHGIQAFGRRWLADGRPAAVYSTASENGLFTAIPFGGGPYVASKHAVVGLMEMLRREAPEQITTGMIIPGWVATDLARNIGMDADEFAAIIVPQIAAGAPWCVSHSYNMVRIEERQAEIAAAYAAHAPRRAGDDALDVTLFVERMGQQQKPD
jgi:NAD(P)-dependent dehydrogenase (short-subunit alcohol dehydrogenase family)